MGQRPRMLKLVWCRGVSRVDGVRCHDSPFGLVSICSSAPLKTNDGNACPEGLGQGFGVERGDVPGGVSTASITGKSAATEDMAQQVPTGVAPCRSLIHRDRSNPAAREGIGNGCGSKVMTESRMGGNEQRGFNTTDTTTGNHPHADILALGRWLKPCEMIASRLSFQLA